MSIYVRQMKDRDLLLKENIPKIIMKIEKMFNIDIVKQIDMKNYICIIPRVNDKKIAKINKKYSNCKIIFSKELKEYQNSSISNKMLKYLITDILSFIIKDNNVKLEMQNLYFLVNEYNNLNVDIINDILYKVKTVNIITNNLENYMKLEEKIYNEKGIFISVVNNKKKSLKKAKIIINLDFKSEEICKYSINRNAIIINCTDEKIKKLRCFEGTIINNVQIDLKEEESLKEFKIYEDFDKIQIYNSESESLNYIENLRQIKEKEVRVKKIIGINGEINKKELANMQNILDKC